MASKVAEDTIIRREGLFFIILDEECEQLTFNLVTLSFDHTFSICQAEDRCKHCVHGLHQSAMRVSKNILIAENDPCHDDTISR